MADYTSIIANGATFDSLMAKANSVQPYEMLWSGTLASGSTATLSSDAQAKIVKYKTLRFKVTNTSVGYTSFYIDVPIYFNSDDGYYYIRGGTVMSNIFCGINSWYKNGALTITTNTYAAINNAFTVVTTTYGISEIWGKD